MSTYIKKGCLLPDTLFYCSLYIQVRNPELYQKFILYLNNVKIVWLFLSATGQNICENKFSFR